jgi:hypothetical protein
MPKNKVSDPITDQEMAFARLVLSGEMTDRQAAQTAGLNPDSAAYIKAKPNLRAYMLEHRAAVEQQLVQQEVDLSRLSRPAVERAVEGLRRLSLDREKVLNRLWEIANMNPEMTRGSITGQVKALSMIVAMENLIPDRRASSSGKNSPTATTAGIYASAGRQGQQATTMEPLPRPAAGRGVTGSPATATPDLPPGQSSSVNRVSPSKAALPYVPLFNSVPDLGLPLSMIKNPFVNAR